jgi:hypothetical protein
MTHPLDVPYPGKDTGTAVRGVADDVTIAGPIRICQHLANVWHLLDPSAFSRQAGSYVLNGQKVFPPMDKAHDWSTWAAESFHNYSWLYFYALDLTEEYLRRYQKTPHGIRHMLAALESAPDAISEDPWTEPTFAKGYGT